MSTLTASRFIGRCWRRLVSATRPALLLALGLLLGAAWPALAQFAPGTGQLAVRSDGFIFWIQDGQRHPVYPSSFSDAQINALPEGGSLNGALQPAPPPVAVQVAEAVRTGRSRIERIPIGETQLCTLLRPNSVRSDLMITVREVVREAWPLIQSTNPSNQLPREGYEYILISLAVQYVDGPRDLPVSIDRSDFTIVDSNDVLHVPAFAVEPRPLVSTTIFPGSQVGGLIAYQVPRGDRTLALVWRYNDQAVRTWFAID